MRFKGWFGRKQFGYGFSPRTWQAWLATAAVVGWLLYDRAYFRPEAYGLPHWTKPVLGAGMVLAYMALAYFTSDGEA